MDSIVLFQQNKTKLATMKDPMMFLRHLRDYGLITDEQFVKKGSPYSKKSVYNALQFIENCGSRHVEKFWNCVNKKHILQLYPVLSALTKKIKPLSNKERAVNARRPKNRKKVWPSTQCTKKTTEHVRRGSHSAPGGQAGPSSQNTSINKKTAKHGQRGGKMELWDNPQHKIWLPVTCGKEKAFLNRTTLYKRKNEFIRIGGKMITPFAFEEIGGKGAQKDWKKSIECKGRSLLTLMKMGILKIPDCKGKRFTLRQ